MAELELGTDLGVIYKNRPVKPSSRRRTAGGGVAIVYNKNKFRLKERRIVGNNFELVCAKGKMEGFHNTVLIAGLYVQPRMTVSQWTDLKSMIADLILQEKAASSNPVILIGGDMNRRDLGPAFEDFDDITEVVHGPTRGTEKLDKTFTNFDTDMATTFVCEPLQAVEGIKSDHNCIVSQFCKERFRPCYWQVKSCLLYTSDAADE